MLSLFDSVFTSSNFIHWQVVDLIWSFWVTLNITFFFHSRESTGIYRGFVERLGFKNLIRRDFLLMRPMGFFLMTSYPLLWGVLLPCCESSSSLDLMGIGRCLVIKDESEKTYGWCCTTLLTRLTESCAVFSRLLGSSVFHLLLFWKNKDCVCTILGHDSGFSLQKFFQKAFGRTITLHWGEWPATGWGIYSFGAFWLLLWIWDPHVFDRALFPWTRWLLSVMSVFGLSCWQLWNRKVRTIYF